MGKEDFYSEAEMASILRKKRSTLQKDRSLGKNHPPYKKIGGIVLYPKKDFEKWMNDHPLHSEIKAG